MAYRPGYDGLNDSQSNVYYSVKSLMNAIESLIPQNQIDPLKEQLAKYYLPAFSLDDSRAPESFVISVYKRPYTDSTCAIIRITRQGLVVSNEVPDPPLGKAIADGDVDFAGGVTLKPSYHTSSDIKDGTWTAAEGFVSPSNHRLIETIASTKGWYDPVIAENRIINAKIYSKVVQDTFRVLSQEDRDKLKEKYDEVDLEIDDYIQVLSSLDDIKAETLDKIDSEAMALDSYNLTPPVSQESRVLRGTQGLPVMIRQAYYDISILDERMQELSDPNSRGAGRSAASMKKRLAQGGTTTGEPISGSPLEPQSSRQGVVPIAERVYIKTMMAISETDQSDNVPFDPIEVFPNVIGEDDANSFDLDLLQLKGRPIFGMSSQNPWVNQWYFENVLKKMGDNDPSFDNLNSYIQTLDEKNNKLLKYFNFHVGKGGQLVAQQAMMKSLLSLCESNLDVSMYAPKDTSQKSRSIFDLIGRSAILGPQGTVPYPKELVDNDDPEKSPVPFSKTGFLCFHPLMEDLKNMLRKGNDNETQYTQYRMWLAGNLLTPDSDHDFTLQLANKITFGGEGYKSQAGLVKGTLFLYRGDSSQAYSGLSSIYPSSPIQYLSLYDDQERVSWTSRQTRAGDSYYKWYKRGRNSIEATNENVGNQGLVALKVTNVDGVVTRSKGSQADDGGQTAEKSDAPDPTNVNPDLRHNELMGYGSGGTVSARTQRVHYGWPNSKYHNDDTDVRLFFKNRGYSMPGLWGSSIALLRTIIMSYMENMIEAYREITGTDGELRAVDVLNRMSTGEKMSMLTFILDTVTMISADNSVKVEYHVNGDGTKTFRTSEDGNSRITNNAYQASYANTSGPYLREIVHDYLKFVSKISTHKTLQLVNSQAGRTIPYGTYIPVEALDNASNPNVELGHYPNVNEEDEDLSSSASIYFRPSQLVPYYDRLEWATNEFKKDLLIKRSSSGIRDEDVPLDQGINMAHKDFLRRHKIDFQHLDFLTKYAYHLKKFQENLETIEPQQSIVKLFEDGVLDSDEKLGEPGLMVKQIRSRRDYYRANSLGVAERYNYENMPTSAETEKLVGSAEYIYVLGLFEEAWNNTDKEDDSEIALQCTYTDILGGTTQNLFETPVRIKYMEPSNPTGVELESKQLLDYLHLVRGLDLREHAYSDHTDLIFEKDIVKNDSEIFPWTKDDFEENKPLKPLDTIWSMSPWVFPRNYFYDVTSYNKYHRVVAIIIPKESLQTIPPQHDSSEIDIIGTLRWKITDE